MEKIDLLNEANRRKEEIQIHLIKWGKKNLRDFSWRKNRTPYRILISEMLLKRTTASAVKRFFPTFIKKFPNFSAIIKVETNELEDELKTLGLQKTRARELKHIANQIITEYNGKIPDSLELLLNIKYIGQYSAGAILTLAFDKKMPMVDSNISRIIGRIFYNLIPEKHSQKKDREIMEILLPEKDFDIFFLSMLDLSAKICSYRFTRCLCCPLNQLCDSSTSYTL